MIVSDVLLFFLYRRAAGERVVTVYVIAAVKPDFPDDIEMRVSTIKSEIDEWEKTFWNRVYRVSRRADELIIKQAKPRVYG
jgi:hypothetical protein